MVDYELNEVFHVQLSESITGDSKYTYQLTSWLKSNLESLTDDDDNPIFAKVNIGFGEDNVKSFGNRATCDVHVNTIEFENDFEESMVDKINSIIVFKIKCGYTDIIFTPHYIKDTRLKDAGLREQPNKSNWYVLGVLELQHHIF